MASLSRPSRPANNNPPPTGPLPSIPKPRQSSAPSGERSPNGTPSPVSALPQRSPVYRAPSAPIVSSTPPTNQDKALASSTNAQSTPSAGLRKTISYNSFSRPSPAPRSLSGSPGPSNNNTPRSSFRTSGVVTGTLMRNGSVTSRASMSALVPSSLNATATIAEDSVPEEDGSPRGRDRPGSSSKETKDKGNVIISVRIRPEKDTGEAGPENGEWLVEGKKASVTYRGKEGGEYQYDNVFTTHDKNAKVYDAAAKRLVRRVMEGYNGTVFAYGMTGTGKTFSMQGTATSPGVIPMAITDIFSYIRETPHREFLLRVSYLEIYNEKIFDLLSATAGVGPGEQPKEDIKLREDNKGNVYATPLKEEIVQSPTQLLRVIARGDVSRRTHSTQFNARSSRSHAVVQIVVESRDRNAGDLGVQENKRAPIIPGGVRVSTLSLIDLAGSERAAESKERRTEGAHINKSLLTLGTVISKLSGDKDKQGRPMDKDGTHLPYRDSKLTRLLQPALSGNSLISILCTLQLGATGSAAMAGHHTIETLNTLKFAARARNNIVSHAKRSEEAHPNVGDAGSRALLDRYRVEIVELRKQLELQKMESDKTKDEQDEKAREVEEQQRHEEQMVEMQLARTALKERIGHLNRLILSSKSIGVNHSRSANGNQASGTVFGTTTDGEGKRRSVRSSASAQTLDANSHELGHRTSTNSISAVANSMNFDEEEEEDNLGENGDGTATLNAQIRNLQADLADKNRYISTLEKRLVQARRSSRSQVGMALASSRSVSEDGDGHKAEIARKDAEINELKEKLDDKDRMVQALRSAARKRDAADVNVTSSAANDATGANSSPTSGGTDQTNGMHQDTLNSRRLSTDSYRSSIVSRPSLRRDSRRSSAIGPPSTGHAAGYSPAHILQQGRAGSNGPVSPKNSVRKNHGVDDMTRMLDDMIRQKMENETNGEVATNGLSHSNSILNGRSSVSPLAVSVRNGMRGKRMSTDSNGMMATTWDHHPSSSSAAAAAAAVVVERPGSESIRQFDCGRVKGYTGASSGRAAART